ncbi:uncharacterized protein LOC107469642 isoform X1 [Arachis duranensis]|uniref:Uncharacterized protein LOC107469642 isoform X1 n=1 Tax=Arachis duranensis TaxID=130453 RepID=A0A6P5MXH0_ARADU|nr:uncharacterized protein LOC107469642 isoform X1 [Arachis duranensis]XP_020989414.1 uncharacterized protein LOC107469642 isoform X1 [Arachis duranensis]XP_052111242.1 uncharacterized protein LOC107469642 isoform X1 [Arachis duranensis]XP_052111243.1 uncharacterized protein LOC107469642 isoform X1 [Arachis duranensis]XP_052111244.1 uncharacterized protein LOC107469642 isoform X1 [Arachis duranensis]XP_052111245.1 uncharacterized protein LOC107469642 isoform X1 [Arachis duranensis]XP_05211124
MGLWTLLEGLLLLANALAIINEDRFLAPREWGFSDFSVRRTKSLKGQIIGLIHASQYMRVPLILLNTIFIIVKFLSGCDDDKKGAIMPDPNIMLIYIYIYMPCTCVSKTQDSG